MVNPIVSLYVAAASRTAAVTPSPTTTPTGHRPSADPLRPGRGFHFRRPGSGGYGPDGNDTSPALLIAICGIAVVVALAAWLFLLWRARRRPSAYASAQGPIPTSRHPEAPR